MTDDPRAVSSSRLSSRELVHELSQHLDFSQWASVTLPGGRTVIRAGDVLERLPLLESGVLGELVLLSYLFRRDPVTVDVVVSQEARLRWIPVQVIEDTLTRHHELLIQLVRFLSRRLGQVQSREQTWLESGVHERVCASLARIIGGLVLPAAGPCVIATTHESLAARCGVSRPRLSRELKQLEDAGQLRLRRGTIEIVDPGWFERHWP
jgi:CRP-like cAMP-binding protein